MGSVQSGPDQMVHSGICAEEIFLRGRLAGSDCAEEGGRVSDYIPSWLNAYSDFFSQLLLPVLNYLLSLLVEVCRV